MLGKPVFECIVLPNLFISIAERISQKYLLKWAKKGKLAIHSKVSQIGSKPKKGHSLYLSIKVDPVNQIECNLAHVIGNFIILTLDIV